MYCLLSGLDNNWLVPRYKVLMDFRDIIRNRPNPVPPVHWDPMFSQETQPHQRLPKYLPVSQFDWELLTYLPIDLIKSVSKWVFLWIFRDVTLSTVLISPLVIPVTATDVSLTSEYIQTLFVCSFVPSTLKSALTSFMYSGHSVWISVEDSFTRKTIGPDDGPGRD